MQEKLNTLYTTPGQSPGFLLWHISTSWRSAIEATLKKFNLTHPQFVVLASTGWLTSKGDHTTQVTIGKMTGLDPNTTSQVLKGMEKKGLIKRAPSSDRRAKSVSLTPVGLQILQEALPAVEQADGIFFQSLQEKELCVLLGLFEKLL